MYSLANKKQNFLEVFIAFCFGFFLISFILPRAFLSISTISLAFCFLLKVFFNKSTFFSLRKSVIFLLISTIFWLATISFFWSENKTEWLKSITVKLPYLVLPLFFIANEKLIKKFEVLFICIICFVIFTGCIFSLIKYFIGYDEINEAYQKAKTLPTIFYDDHLRFSFFAFVGVVLAWHLLKSIKLYKFVFYFFIGFVSLYIHILAAKIGMICLYVSLIIAILNLKTNKKWFLLFGVVIIFIILAATLPSLSARLNYFIYDFEQWSKGDFKQGLNDGNRILSLKSGWYIFKQNIWFGHGFGDITTLKENFYNNFYAFIPSTERLPPLNIFLHYACGAGIFGVFIIGFSLFYPLTKYIYTNYAPVLCFLIGHLIFLNADCNTEVQYGSTLSALFYCWFIAIANSKYEHKKGYFNL